MSPSLPGEAKALGNGKKDIPAVLHGTRNQVWEHSLPEPDAGHLISLPETWPSSGWQGGQVNSWS